MCNLSESQEGKKASQIFEEQCKSFEQRLLEEQQNQNKKLLDMIWGIGKPILNKKDFQFDTFTPTYSQVIESGFRRQAPKSRDDVFNEAHGYPYFLVNYEADNFIIEWDVLTHELSISVCDVLIGKISFEKAKEIIEAGEPQSSNQ
jgi:hypothetical protein